MTIPKRPLVPPATRRGSGASVAAGILVVASVVLATPLRAQSLRIMNVGLGSGVVTGTGINCGSDCDETYGSSTTLTLTAAPAPGSSFVRWLGDCAGVTATCTLPVSAASSVRAEFGLSSAIPTITDFTPTGIAAYLTANPSVNTAARLLAALPAEFRQNWIMMSRSESLQTGTAESPRFLLPSADARHVFTFGLATSSSYPGSHPSAIEFMQWDAAESNFRFHEVVLDAIPAVPDVPLLDARTRGVSVDDTKCPRCHSTRNILNPGPFPGTTGVRPGLVKAKSRPNWDTYDSWGGMLPLNRDRIYQGSVEAAAFRRLLNPWSWRMNPSVRAFIEQLDLQPPNVTTVSELITRVNGGANDGHIIFGFDVASPILVEPPPTGPSSSMITYAFDAIAGPPPGSSVVRGGPFLTLHHSSIPNSDEGRGVRLFDALGGAAGNLNQTRIGDEVASHRFATGSVPLDPRPIALAITKGCLDIDELADTVTAVTATPLTIDLEFFDLRNGMTINQLVADTRTRAQSIPRRKADIQRLNLERSTDVYLLTPGNGLIQEYGSATSQGTDISLPRLRQEVFRRPIDVGSPDSTVMGGVFVDRELYGSNTEPVALYRYFLEPLGISVDRWSMGVRGRSRTYSFADVFGGYLSALRTQLEANLTSDPISGLGAPYECEAVVAAVNGTLGALPGVDDVPTFTDVQRIFNKSCIECHGGLNYPPFSAFFPVDYLDLSENEDLSLGNRLDAPHAMATSLTSNDPATSLMFQRINETSEACPNGVMPCGGPRLSQTDIETIRRWIIGSRPNTVGDPHIRTIDGVEYDFQSAGEFVLLRGENLEIQVRQTAAATETPLGPNPHTGLTSCVSINTAIAMKVGGHRITYQPGVRAEPEPTGLQLRIDGKLVRLGSGFVLPGGGRVLPTTAPGGIQIEIPGGADVVVTPGFWAYYQLWYFNIDVRHARATEGVMGAVAPDNWLPALPNGDLMGPRPASLAQRYEDLYEEFADAWRVTHTTSLFDYGAGVDTNTFTIQSWPRDRPQSCRLPHSDGKWRRPPPPRLPLAAARLACAVIVDDNQREDCEQDVMVTGDLGFAATYFLAETIQQNPVPSAPTLVTPANDKIDLPRTITFTWKSSVDSHDLLIHSHCVWPTDQMFNFTYCRTLPKYTLPFRHPTPQSTTVFHLKPGTAYFWKVIAEDGKGGTVESETRRFATKR